MRYKATLVAGFTTGYVLGAKAGRQRYETIMQAVRNIMEKPAVQQTAGVVQAQAADLTQSAKRVVNEKVGRSSGTYPGVGRTMEPPVYPVPPTVAPVSPTIPPDDFSAPVDLTTPGDMTTDGGAARH